MFLMSKQDGLVENAFVGKNKQGKSFKVGLCWGHDGIGLKHLIEKHIIVQNDFENIEELTKVIQNVLENGKKYKERDNKTVIVNGKYKVVLKNESNKYIVTAFNSKVNDDEKLRNPEEQEKKREELILTGPNSITQEGTSYDT
jgi:hypothetical protein